MSSRISKIALEHAKHSRFSLKAGLLLCILISAFILPNLQGLAEENLQEVCQLEKIEEECQILKPDECRKLLEKCEGYYREESARIEEDLSKTEKEKKTLQNQIYILRNKINKLNLQISQSNVMIKDLGFQIEDTEVSVEETSFKIRDSRDQLANILQVIYEADQKSLIEILLSEKELSDFFDDLLALEILNSKNQELLKNIEDLKSHLERQKEALDEEKEELGNLVLIQTFQRKESAQTKEEKDWLLQLTEEEFQKILKEKEETEKRASEIRAKIYELIGVRKAVTYEEALDVAKYAASLAGIRPALLLGVLSQESQIGKNVGQCYLKNPSTGEGVVAYNSKKISRVMKPSRDVPYFLEIIEELNKIKGLALDPYQTLVSCPMSFGWGGAMGPAQFIPSTWVKCGYKKRVEEIIKNAADPWDIRDASLAASLYLKDGLDRYGTEGKAVQSYFCGYAKNDYWCRWYEKNVLYLAQCHQSFINSGSMSLECQKAIGLK